MYGTKFGQEHDAFEKYSGHSVRVGRRASCDVSLVASGILRTPDPCKVASVCVAITLPVPREGVGLAGTTCEFRGKGVNQLEVWLFSKR